MDIDSINFLPVTYQRRRVERHRLWRHGLLLVVLCGSLAGWWMVQQHQTQRLRDEAVMYENQVAAAREQMKLVEALRREYAELNSRLELWQRLGQPVSHGDIFAMLAEQMPASVVLTRLEVRSHRPTPQEAAGPSRRRSAEREAAAATGPTGRLELDLTGIAPDDMTLANLLNQLNRHPLFEGVKLHFSRAVTIHDATGRQFRIDMRIPLDRDYQFKPTEGVAHVD